LLERDAHAIAGVAAEVLVGKEKHFFAKYLLGNFPEIGFHHHRWFVEIEGTHLRFTAKTAALPANRRYYITRGDIGRNLTEQESGLGFFWHGGFTFGEVFVGHGEDYPAFRFAFEVTGN